MNTPSHFLLHLGIRKFVSKKYNINISKSFVLGAIAPDVGLYVCVLFYSIYAHFFL
jgi:CDP-diacylglycerol pyrophosphatase